MTPTTRSKSLLITLLLLTLASASVLALVIKRRYDKTFWTRITVAQVQADINQHISAGSPRVSVVAYLDGKKIAHSYYGAEIYRDTKYYNCEIALERDAASSWLVTTDIQIIFRFDAAQKLLSYQVQEINTGP